jgi:hypothetical protein
MGRMLAFFLTGGKITPPGQGRLSHIRLMNLVTPQHMRCDSDALINLARSDGLGAHAM